MEIIERTEELAALRRARADGPPGSVSVAVIEGAAGCGKTLLLQAAVTEAATAGCPVVEFGRSGAARVASAGCPRDTLTEPAPPASAGVRSAIPARPVSVELAPTELAPTELAPTELAPAELAPAGLASAGFASAAFAATRLTSPPRPQEPGHGPLVISVDDVHLADAGQLRNVLDVMEAHRSQGVVVLVTQTLASELQDARFHTELLRQDTVRRVRVRRLGPEGTARLLAGRLGAGLPVEARGAPAAAAFHAATGGNPLLLRALGQESFVAPADPAEPGAGRLAPSLHGPFAQAALACVRHSGPDGLDLAVALALLGPETGVELLSDLTGMSDAAVREGLRTFDEAGLVEGCRFRHPVVGTAVLESVSRRTRADLHTRAAGLLHSVAAHPVVVARHLCAAQRIREPWGVSVLQDAAHHMLACDEPQEAVRMLDLAARECRDERLRAAARVSIAVITCRQNPTLAEQLLADAVAEQQSAGGPRYADEMLTRILVQHREKVAVRRSAGAAERRVLPVPGAVRPHPGELWRALLGVEDGGPGRRGTAAGDKGRGDTPSPGAGPRGRLPYPVLSAASTLWTPWPNGPQRPAADAAESRLMSVPLIDSSLPAVINDLKTLAVADRPHTAVELGCRFRDEAVRRHAPGWEAVLSATLAEASLLCGQFPQALEFARRAATLVPLRRHAMVSVGPVVSQVLALTAMGRHAEAGGLLGTVVPERLCDSVEGFAYLRARGRYLLACGDPESALADFLTIGELARAHGVDQPTLIPWRLEAAEALHRSGEIGRAAQLLKEQGEPRDAGSHRLRGIRLRLLAAQAGSRSRVRLMRQSIEELQQSKDLYESARSIAALADAYAADGSPAKARMARRRAWRQAKECGALQLCEEILPGFEPEEGEVPGRATAALGRLSAAERRVAQLAARGHANREISTRLHITVSTVEQHLTRIYRKLDIQGRGALEWEYSELDGIA